MHKVWFSLIGPLHIKIVQVTHRRIFVQLLFTDNQAEVNDKVDLIIYINWISQKNWVDKFSDSSPLYKHTCEVS